MRKFIFLLALIASTVGAQTLRLRSDAAGPRLFVDDFTIGPLSTLTFTQPHGLKEGDEIYCSGGVIGAIGFNGYLKVKTTPSSNQITMTDDSGVDIPGYSGTKTRNTNSGVDYGYAVCGKYQRHTIRARPSGLFGPIKSNFRDRLFGTGGPGSGTSTVPTDSPAAFAFLKAQADLKSTPSGCDGVTPSLCTVEESIIKSNLVINIDNFREGHFAMFNAQMWQITGNVRYLNAAKYYLSQFHRAPVTWTAIDYFKTAGSGMSGNSDFLEQDATRVLKWSAAYDAIYSQLTTSERNAFLTKLWKGAVNGDCSYPTFESDRVNGASGTNLITGTGIGAKFSPGQYIYVKYTNTLRKRSDGTLAEIEVYGDGKADLRLTSGVTASTATAFTISGSTQADLNGSFTFSSYDSANTTVKITGVPLTVPAGVYSNSPLQVDVLQLDSQGKEFKVEAIVDANTIQLDTNLTTTQRTVNSPYMVIPPYSSAACGKMWYVLHHSYGPTYNSQMTRLVRTNAAATASATELSINPGDINNFRGLQTPFHLEKGTSGSEFMTVTSVDFATSKLTVTRGVDGTPATSITANTQLFYRRFPKMLVGIIDHSKQGIGITANNLNHTRAVSPVFVAFNTVHEDFPESIYYAENGWNHYHDIVIPLWKRLLAGWSAGGGNAGYQWPRFWDLSGDLITSVYNATVPTLDASGPWFYTTAYSQAYTQVPWLEFTKLKPPISSDSGPERYMSAGMFRGGRVFPIYNYLAPGSPEQKRSYKFQKELGLYAYGGGVVATNDYYKHLSTQIAYVPETTEEEDYRDKRAFFFTHQEDNPGNGYNLLVSRQHWSCNTSWLLVHALAYPNDHWGNAVLPGMPLLSQGNCDTTPNRFGSDLILPDASGGISGNTRERQSGVLSSGGYPKNYSESPVSVQKESIGTDYAYASIEGSKFYLNTSKFNREFVHWIPATGKSYVLFHDGVASASTITNTLQWTFYRGSSAGAEVINNSPADTLIRSGNRVLHVKTAQEVGSVTEILYPPTGAADNFSGLTNASWGGRLTHEQGNGTTDIVNWLTAIEPFRGTTDPAPVWSTFTAGAYRGAFVNDATCPVVAMFRNDATVSQNGVTYTPPSYTGTGCHLVTGLAAGTYSVSVAGSTVIPSQAVDSKSGTIRFNGTHGQVIVQQLGAALEITTTALPGAEVGTPYSFNLAAIGGTAPHTWTSSTLPGGFSLSSGGTLSAASPVSAGVYPIDFTATDSDSATANRTLSLTITGGSIPDPFTISPNTGSILAGTAGTAYQFEFDLTGGTSPYACAGAGLPPGLTASVVSGKCRVSGTTSVIGTHELTITATDDDADDAVANVTLTIAPSSSGTIQITVKAAGTSAIAEIRKPGLNANASCTFVLRNLENEVVQSGDIPPGGPVRQTTLRSLDPGQSYKFETSCPDDTGFRQFVSVEVTGTRSVVLKFPPITGMADVLVEFGLNGPEEQSITAPCASGCSVDLPGLTRGQIYYIRYTYKDAGDSTIAHSKVFPILVN